MTRTTTTEGDAWGRALLDHLPHPLRLRIRHGDLATPWWPQRNVRADELVELVAGTGWAVDHQIEVGIEHWCVLRKAAAT